MFLNLLRKKMKLILWITLILIIPAFVALYGWNQTQQAHNIALKINGEVITYPRVNEVWQNLSLYYRKIYGDRFEAMEKALNLERRAVNSIIEQTLLLQAANKESIPVTDREIIERIKKDPLFQNKEGKFDPQIFKEVMVNITPDQWERWKERVRENLLIEKIRREIMSGARVSEQELWEEFVRRNERAKVEYLLFAPPNFRDKVQIEEKEVEEYYNAHKERFKTPPKIQVEYFFIKTEEVKKDIKISEDEIANYYKSHKDEFRRPEEVRVSQILIRAKPGAPDEEDKEAREKIENIYKKILEGADFSTLAKEFSEDKLTASKGGDLGFFSRGRMDPELEKVAFSLKKGEVSKPVKTSTGYHLLKVIDKREAKIDPLEKVRLTIRDKLLAAKAEQLAQYKAEDLSDKLWEVKDWNAFAQKKGLKLITTGFFSRDEVVEGIGWAPQFNSQAFSLKANEPSDAVKVPQGYCVIRLKDKKPSQIPLLEEVLEKVKAELREEKAEELAKSKALECLEKIRKGTSLEEIAEKNTLPLLQTQPFTRGGYIPGVGYSREFSQAAFALQPGETSGLIKTEKGFYLLKLLEKIPPDKSKFEEQRKSLYSLLLRDKQHMIYTQWYQTLKARAKITPSPQIESLLSPVETPTTGTAG